MHHMRNITNTLHNEHMATITLLNRMEEQVMSHKPGNAPDASAEDMQKLLRDIANNVESEITGHFSFEEEHLFTRLAEMGDENIGVLLTEEHHVMLPIGERLVVLCKEARQNGFTAETWEEFRRLVGEFIERMIAHIQKEEMGLLPVLDDVIDEEEDGQLSTAYAMSR